MRNKPLPGLMKKCSCGAMSVCNCNSPLKAKAKGVDGKACWKGYRLQGTKMKGGKRVDNCVKIN